MIESIRIKATTDPVLMGYKVRKMRWSIMNVLLASVLLILCIVALAIGNKVYSLRTILSVFSGENIQGATFAIYTLRLPRMLAGLLAGIAFGIAGSTFQTMLRNPLASPDIIGVTSGTSIATVFCILVLKIGGTVVSTVSVLSGLTVAALIYILSKGASFSGGRLIIIGLGIQAMLSSSISFLLLRASQYDVPGAMRWLSGNLNGIRLTTIPSLATVVLLFSTIIMIQGNVLRILELGEHSAITLGVKTNYSRILLLVSAVFLLAFATSTTGPIAFVSFLSGPIANQIVGKGQSNELSAGLVGGILVIASDLIGQYAFGTKFPVGIITGLIGAPYLLYLLIVLNRRGGSA